MLSLKSEDPGLQDPRSHPQPILSFGDSPGPAISQLRIHQASGISRQIEIHSD